MYYKYQSDLNSTLCQNNLEFGCASTSALLSSLSRSIGIQLDLYGFLRKPWYWPFEYKTNVIHTFGNFTEENKKVELWKSYTFEWHQFNILGEPGVFSDAVMEYEDCLDNKCVEKYVINLILSDYKDAIFTDLVYNELKCPGTGINKILYKPLQ